MNQALSAEVSKLNVLVVTHESTIEKQRLEITDLNRTIGAQTLQIQQLQTQLAEAEEDRFPRISLNNSRGPHLHTLRVHRQ